MRKRVSTYLDRRIDAHLAKQDAAHHAVRGKNLDWALDRSVISRSEAAAIKRVQKSMKSNIPVGRADRQMVQEMTYRLMMKYNLDVEKSELFLQPREPKKLKKFLQKFERY